MVARWDMDLLLIGRGVGTQDLPVLSERGSGGGTADARAYVATSRVSGWRLSIVRVARGEFSIAEDFTRGPEARDSDGSDPSNAAVDALAARTRRILLCSERCAEDDAVFRSGFAQSEGCFYAGQGFRRWDIGVT